MPTNKTGQDEGLGLEGVMRAVLALLADEREARIANDKGARKTEVLLSEAGFSIGEISTLLGKKYDTVKMTLRRAKPKKAEAA
jgi:DNA-directed RNA polymerase specialized sigma24 family protein